MSSFRKVKTLLIESGGAYFNGVWQQGTRSSITTMASVQPVTVGRDMKVVPEGRHMSDFVKIYTDDKLQVTADGEGKQPDIIVHEGFGYEIINVDPNRSDVINHYKYIASKVFRFTDTADWLNGNLKRP